LALRGHDRLDEHALGRVFELEVQALDQRSAFCKLTAQLDVKLGIAGKAFQIIKITT
jgi:hypothetical protein